MLECCVPLDNVRERGVTLEQFARIAACNTLQVRLVRAPNAPPAESLPSVHVDALTAAETPEEHEFRRVLKRCTAVDNRVLVCAYSRRVVGQTGIVSQDHLCSRSRFTEPVVPVAVLCVSASTSLRRAARL